MKKFFTALRVLLCVMCLGLMSAAHAASAWDGWTGLSQADRNARIVAQAQSAIGQLAGQCKTFAVDVVRVVSNQATGYSNPRILPYTADWVVGSGDMSSYRWDPSDYRSTYVDPTPGNGTSTLFGVVPGNIIQMRITLKGGAGYTPHTSIIEVNNTYTQVLTLIESNMDNDGLVKRRWINYPDFVNQLQDKYMYYTIYQIR